MEQQMEKLFANPVADASETEKRLTEGLNDPKGKEDNTLKSSDIKGNNQAKDVEAKMSASKVIFECFPG